MSKLNVLLVKPNQKPEIVEIENTLHDMQKLVEGNIETICPFEDENIVLVCNENGKNNRLKLNRVIYYPPEYIEVPYKELKEKFRKYEENVRTVYNAKHLTARIVFTEDSFEKEYSESSRTYQFSSDNKAFQPGMRGYSIFGSAIDGSDNNVRLDLYMKDERGEKDGWKIEKCLVKKESDQIMDIIAGNFFLCYENIDTGSFESIPEKLMNKYLRMFITPEQFLMDLNTKEIIVKKIRE